MNSYVTYIKELPDHMQVVCFEALADLRVAKPKNIFDYPWVKGRNSLPEPSKFSTSLVNSFTWEDAENYLLDYNKIQYEFYDWHYISDVSLLMAQSCYKVKT